MEFSQKEAIRKNLPNLLELTQCSSNFLAIFLSKGTFSKQDVESIETHEKNNGRSAGCKMFYELLESRSGSFEVLLDALKETSQSGVLDILDASGNFKSITKKFTQLRSSSSAPEYITDYVQQQEFDYLIVCSEDCGLTCQRFLKSCPKSKFCSVDNIFDVVSAPQIDLEKETIMVVNLEDGIDPLYIIEPSALLKVVFVTRVKKTELQEKLVNLTVKFQITEDNLMWNDLSPQIKLKITTGLKKSLDLDIPEMTNALSEIDAKKLVDLMHGKFPVPENLFINTIPPLISYYISRNIQTRCIISKSIFKSEVDKELFLFSGIEKSVLSDLCRDKLTETSSNVLKHKTLISEFIFLENELDFDKMSSAFPEYSIHLLEYEGSELIWKKSEGNISTIQNHVATNQCTVPESEYIRNILAQNQKFPICISDTPGKGKSLLLAKIAMDLKKHHKTGLVGFVIVSELIKRLKESGDKEDLDFTIISTISSFLSTSPLGHAYLRKNKYYLKDLMLDGFDEVKAEETEYALECIKKICLVFIDTRIWITTRPHLLPKLEVCLKTLGHNITPFDRSAQIKFLTSFWAQDLGECDTSLLPTFAEKCLESIKYTLGPTNEEIAGIPLQCLLIGETFEEDAKRFLKSPTSQVSSFQEISTIGDLYKKLIEKKFTKFSIRYNRKQWSKSEIINAHMGLALKVLYPSQVSQFSKFLVHNISMQEIYDFGLVEATSFSAHQFLHRTFAEYFVALFVSEMLKMHQENVIGDFLFDHILKSGEDTALVLEQRFLSLYQRQNIYLIIYKFKQNVICYFLNLFIKDIEFSLPLRFTSRDMDSFDVVKIAEASIYQNLSNIFTKFILASKYKDDVISGNFLLCAVHFAELYFFNVIMREYLSLNDTSQFNFNYGLYLDRIITESNKVSDPDKNFTLLHFAMKRGDYAIVNYLIDRHYRTSLEQNDSMVCHNLLSFLLTNSNNNSESVIEQKKQIIKYLASIKKNLLTSENRYGQFPIQCRQTHVDLIEELWELSNNFYTKRNIAIQVLQTFAEEMMCKGQFFYRIVKRVFSSLDNNTIEEILTNGSFFRACCRVEELDIEILEFFKAKCPKFCKHSSETTIDVFLNSIFGQSKAFSNWLLNNMTFTIENLKEILLKCLPIHKSDYLNLVLVYLNQQIGEENILSFCDIYEFIFTGQKITHENFKAALNLISFFIVRDHSENFLEVDYETALPSLINLGLSNIDELKDQNLVQHFCANFLKLTWIALVCGKLEKEKYESLIKLNLRSIDIRAVDNSGNSLLHIFAQCFDYSPRSGFKIMSSFLNKLEFMPGSDMWKRFQHIDVECVWNVLLENKLNILHCNNNHLTPICLLFRKDCSQQQRCEINIRAILLAMTQMFKQGLWEVENLHQMFYLVIKSHCIKEVRKVYETYIELCDSIHVAIKNVTVTFNGEPCNFMDAALQNGSDDILEFVQNVLKINTPLLSPPDYCIHRGIIMNHGIGDSKFLKFIQCVAETFPQEIQRLFNQKNEENLVPLALPELTFYQARLLLKFGANINATDSKGNTPLHLALLEGSRIHIDSQLVSLLIHNGSNINAQNLKMETPMLILVKRDVYFEPIICLDSSTISLFEILINEKADPTISDENGNTSLHCLMEKIVSGEVFHRIVDIFVSAGYTQVFNVRNKNGQSPLQLADKYFHVNPNTKQLLRKHGVFYFEE